MRYKRTLSTEQIKLLINSPHLSNQELAKKFGTTRELISSYRYRARKAGIDVPKTKPYQHTNTIESDLKKIADQ